jgi:hypothetical protein
MERAPERPGARFPGLRKGGNDTAPGDSWHQKFLNYRFTETAVARQRKRMENHAHDKFHE